MKSTNKPFSFEFSNAATSRAFDTAPILGPGYRGWGSGFRLAGAALAALLAGPVATFAQEEVRNEVITLSGGAGGAHAVVLDDGDAKDGKKVERRVIVRAVESPRLAEWTEAGKEVGWLGLGTEEVSEAMTAQLKLAPGQGLLVNYVAKDSPADKAGLKKNDVLLEYDGQRLVLPAQFRKLVQTGKEGDEVGLTLLREGEKKELKATLGKTMASVNLVDSGTWAAQMPAFNIGAEVGSKLKAEMEALRESLAKSGVDKEKLRIEIQRSLEDARKSLQDSLRSTGKASGEAMREARRALEEISRGVDVDKNARVVIRKNAREVKTMVNTDDSGTYVIVATPEKHLTATDKKGKVLFEGRIETSEEQEKVPRPVWEKVEPMLDQMRKDKPADKESEPREESSLEESEENS